MKPTDTQLVTLLEDAFASEYSGVRGETLSQCNGGLDMVMDGGTVLLGAADASDAFYAIPIDMEALRDGIDRLTGETEASPVAASASPSVSDAEDDASLRPHGVAPHAWTRMTPGERAAAAMHAKTQEWDWRGSLSEMRPVGIQREELAIVARVLLALGPHEFASLAKIGQKAAAEV